MRLSFVVICGIIGDTTNIPIMPLTDAHAVRQTAEVQKAMTRAVFLQISARRSKLAHELRFDGKKRSSIGSIQKYPWHARMNAAE